MVHFNQNNMSTNLKIFVKWSSRIILIIYALINIDAWVIKLFPNFYENIFSQLHIYTLYNFIGFYIFFAIVVMIILKTFRLIFIEKIVFWLAVLFLISNLFLMYLEINKQGDT